MQPAVAAVQTTDSLQIKSLFQSLEPDPTWSFAEYTSRDRCRLTHGYHRYPAKFIPQLVYRLLDEYIPAGETATVNDLFMGSGTTMACAIERGQRAIGTDINEVACLIARAKATPIEPEQIERRRQWLYERLRPLDAGYTGSGLPTALPAVDRLDRWFPERQMLELSQILAALEEIESPTERDFFLCNFSHILKNCSAWDMGSTKPTRNPNKEPRRPWPTFLVHLQKMAERNRAFWRAVPPAVRDDLPAYLQIVCSDARRQPCPAGSVDLQITSSPYVTSYEYADLHQLTALWLGYTTEICDFRAKFIGTARPSNHRALHGQSTIVQEMLDQLAGVHLGLSLAVQRFFSDMRECFDESFRILRPGGRSCFVIGNTCLKGVPILNAQAFFELLQEAGFELERIIQRQIPLKTLPQVRNPSTGRFARSAINNPVHAYPTEYILIARKPV